MYGLSVYMAVRVGLIALLMIGGMRIKLRFFRNFNKKKTLISTSGIEF